MITKKLVTELAEERMKERDNGLFIVDLTISSSNVIRLELDKHNGGVTVEDCVSVSRNIEHNLDREQQDFELHVSSAGLDKPLRVHAQYVKNIGRSLEVKTASGKTEGKLVEVNDNTIVLERGEKQLVEGKKKRETVVIREELPFADIIEARIIISFK
ncbi:MAG TPA: ribosome assembly cofactor RimP [Fluviicola sp.]|nr:ribosome assembly cofactor RimP [Fluviicola sp.]